MKYSTVITAAAVAVGVQAQGAAIGIAPEGSAPTGCQMTESGYYQITVVQPASSASKRSLEKRAECGGEGTLVFEISNGVLTDRAGRIGSIVANRQFQFDGPPPQTGAIYTGGFSICPNSSLALGPTTNFYQCRSGSFYNLYDQPSESDCRLVKFNTVPCTISGSSGSSASGSAAASQQSDGQPTASSAPVASQQTDGQPTASSAPVVSQQTDGQPTVSSAAPAVSQQSDGQPTASSAPVVSQISDGQPQATNATMVMPSPSAIATGAAGQFVASGAVAVVGAVAAFFL